MLMGCFLCRFSLKGKICYNKYILLEAMRKEYDHMSSLASDIRDILLALNMMSKDKRTGYKYFYDYTNTLKYTPQKKKLYTTYQVIKYHKTKMEDEDNSNKVVLVRDYVANANTLLDLYQWLGGEYNNRLRGE